MGYEYHVKFKIENNDKVEELLRSLPHFQKIKLFQGRTQFIYRTPENSGEIPSGYAEIESNRIYFCDCGGSDEVLEELVFRVRLSYKKLEVIDHSD